MGLFILTQNYLIDVSAFKFFLGIDFPNSLSWKVFRDLHMGINSSLYRDLRLSLNDGYVNGLIKGIGK